MRPVVVIGGGFVGQLVQLAQPKARVLDWKKKPVDHLETRQGPQYLWEPIEKLPSTSFEVTTLVDGVEPTSESILAYKTKIGKQNDGGDWGLQFKHKTVGWHSEMPTPRIEYEQVVDSIDLGEHLLYMRSGEKIQYGTLINTIPLPAFMEMAGAVCNGGPFKLDPIFMRVEERLMAPQNEGLVLNYVSKPSIPWYRVTLSGVKLYYESLRNELGCRRIYPGKIHTHPESENVINHLREFDIYCYGRFAAWRPDELAHETWKEIQRAPWRH